MFTRIALAAALFAATATTVSADTISLTAEMQAKSLHTGAVDMTVYYMDRDDHFEVVATYASKSAPDAPARLRMGLVDGDHVSFAMPGETHVAYSFERNGDTITVDSDLTVQRVSLLAE